MPAKPRVYVPTCACGARKVDGRCQAVPSCSDFVKPAKIGAAAARLAKEREREATRIDIDRQALAEAARRVDPRHAVRSDQARERARAGWHKGRRRLLRATVAQ